MHLWKLTYAAQLFSRNDLFNTMRVPLGAAVNELMLR